MADAIIYLGNCACGVLSIVTGIDNHYISTTRRVDLSRTITGGQREMESKYICIMLTHVRLATCCKCGVTRVTDSVATIPEPVCFVTKPPFVADRFV